MTFTEKKISEDAKELWLCHASSWQVTAAAESRIGHGFRLYPNGRNDDQEIRKAKARRDYKSHIRTRDNGKVISKEQIEAVLGTPAGDRKSQH